MDLEFRPWGIVSRAYISLGFKVLALGLGYRAVAKLNSRAKRDHAPFAEIRDPSCARGLQGGNLNPKP